MKKILLLIFVFNLCQINAQIVTAIAEPVTCNGGNNGSINAIASSGVSPYTFSLSNSSTILIPSVSIPIFTNLPAGVYTVTVTDAISNTASQTVTITEPTALNCSSNVSGNTLTIFANGATPSYVYSILGGPFQSSPIFDSLMPGNYTYLVQDANGCFCSGVSTINFLSNFDVSFEDFKYSLSSNWFTFSNSIGVDEILIYNILGEKVFESKSQTSISKIDLSNTSNGMFFVKLRVQNQQKTIKIIKN